MESKSAHDQSPQVADLFTAALAAAFSIPLERNGCREAKQQVRPALFAGQGSVVSTGTAVLCRRVSFSAVEWMAAVLWLWWLLGWCLQAAPSQPTAELQESKDF